MPNSNLDMLGYRLLQRTITLCAGILIFCGLIVLYVALDKAQSRCEQTQEIRAYIYEASNRSLDALPTISYYRNHPDELARQQAALRVQRDTFSQPLDCSLL
jgi:hypothetical protein